MSGFLSFLQGRGQIERDGEVAEGDAYQWAVARAEVEIGEDTVVLSIDLPAFDDALSHVETDGHFVSLELHRVSAPEGAGLLGFYRRTVPLGVRVMTDKPTCTWADGKLTVVLTRDDEPSR